MAKAQEVTLGPGEIVDISQTLNPSMKLGVKPGKKQVRITVTIDGASDGRVTARINGKTKKGEAGPYNGYARTTMTIKKLKKGKRTLTFVKGPLTLKSSAVVRIK